MRAQESSTALQLQATPLVLEPVADPVSEAGTSDAPRSHKRSSPAGLPHRSRGTGTVYPHGNRWRVRIRDKNRERTWHFETRAEALAHLDAVLKERERGVPMLMLPGRGGWLTLNAWLDEWLAQVQISLRPGTVEAYRRHAESCVRSSVAFCSPTSNPQLSGTPWRLARIAVREPSCITCTPR